jgi:microcystin-dependent protein
MKKLILLSFFVSVLFVNAKAQDEYIGIVKLFAGNFCPTGWMYCEGQTLQIAQNQALYAVIGATYGGDGQTNFKLPDLRGRVVVDAGAGVGLSVYNMGQIGGSETITTTSADVSAGRGIKAVTAGAAYNNHSPYLALRYIICIQGIFPPRD